MVAHIDIPADRIADFCRVLRCNTVFDSVSGNCDWPMVVTMSFVRMMQMSVHQIIHMIPMWYRLVSAALSVHMPGLMRLTGMTSCTSCRIRFRHLQCVFVKVPVMRMMQMPVMQIIHMPLMQYCRVPAVRAMYVRMVVVYVMFHNLFLLSLRLLYLRPQNRLLGRVCQCIKHQASHMLIRQRIQNMFPLPSACQ